MPTSDQAIYRSGLWSAAKAVSLALIVTLGLAGCASKPQLVYVDLTLVPVDTTAAPPTGPSLVASKSTSSAEGLPALPEQSLYMGGAQDSLDRAREIREKNRDRALREIENRLFEAAKVDAKKEADDQRASLLPGYNDDLDTVYDNARGIFETYAEPAGIFRLRLADTVGFPDPDPDSRRQPDALDRTAVRRFERANLLRETLTNLSDMFWADFDGSLAAVNDAYRQELAKIDVALAIRQDQLIAEAKEKAKQVLASDGEGPGLTAIGMDSNLPAQPAVSANIVGPLVNVTAPRPRRADWKPVQTQEVKDELKIWLALNGYELAKKKGTARDATQEFIVWRKGTRTGL